MPRLKTLHKDRPAETATGLAGIVAALLAQLLGIKNADTVSEVAILIAALPGFVTYVVTLLHQND